MFQTSRTKTRLLSSCVLAGLALAGAASLHAQMTTDDFEVGIESGGSFWKQKKDPLMTEFMPSGMIGASATENFSDHLGFEQRFDYMQNPIRFHQAINGLVQDFTLSERVLQFQNALLFYFNDRSHIIRPYVEFGVGLDSYRPTNDSLNLVALPGNAGLNAAGLSADTVFSFTYGGGLKFHLTRHFGVRAEVRGVYSMMPHLGLAATGVPPNLYIPQNGALQGVQASSGLMFVWGRTEEVVLPVAAPGFTGVSIQPASPAAVCPGTPVSFTATVENVSPNHTPTYRWTVDGQNAGDNSPNFSFPATAPGTHQVGLTVLDNITQLVKQAAAVTVTVNDHSGPSITANADKTDLQFGDKAQLYPHPQAGTCPGNLSVAWTVTEGTVSGTDPATYDSSTVQFDANNAGPQTKPVTATATVTDDKGGTASATVNLTVSKAPSFVRQDDIIFPTGNSRVNNCGKRILIDQVYPALTSGQYANYDVVIVGHEGNEPMPKTARERRRGRRRHEREQAMAQGSLAMQRAENVAAVLSSGEGICPRPGIDLGRIKIATVGPNQGADLRKPICAASIRERRGSAVEAADDLLKDQRVEIWFVPRGSNMPPSASNAQQAPDSIKPLGCPK